MPEEPDIDVPRPVPDRAEWARRHIALTAEAAALAGKYRVRIAVPSREAWVKIRAQAVAREHERICYGVVALLRQMGKAMEGRDLAELLECDARGIDYHLRTFAAVTKSIRLSGRLEGVYPHQFRRRVAFYTLAA